MLTSMVGRMKSNDLLTPSQLGTKKVEGGAYIPCLVHVLCMYVVRLLRSTNPQSSFCSAHRLEMPDAHLSYGALL